MKRFEFALERVLHFKKQRERLAEARQLEARARLQAAEAVLKELRRELEKTAMEMRARLGEGLELGAWTAGYRKVEQLGRKVSAAEEAVRLAAKHYMDASAARKQLAIEVEGLKQLRERQWHEHQAAAARAEQIMLDDIGLRRWQESAGAAWEEKSP
ncbi:MAG: flagellar FliJ family protein [Planctomycetes bacterium]|nr:flagellar FliJ family protein [Planctomycetota bacterium]